MNASILAYGRQKIDEINGDLLMLPRFRAKTAEIIRNVMHEYRAGYMTAEQAAREIENAEQTVARIYRYNKGKYRQNRATC